MAEPRKVKPTHRTYHCEPIFPPHREPASLFIGHRDLYVFAVSRAL